MISNLGTGILLVNGFAKDDIGDLNLELNLALLGERHGYFNCMVDFVVAPPSFADAINPQGEIDIGESDHLMLIDIAKSIDLPKGVFPEGKPARIRLKRFDGLELAGAS